MHNADSNVKQQTKCKLNIFRDNYKFSKCSYCEEILGIFKSSIKQKIYSIFVRHKRLLSLYAFGFICGVFLFQCVRTLK